jgi:hypothetical protein
VIDEFGDKFYLLTNHHLWQNLLKISANIGSLLSEKFRFSLGLPKNAETTKRRKKFKKSSKSEEEEETPKIILKQLIGHTLREVSLFLTIATLTLSYPT